MRIYASLTFRTAGNYGFLAPQMERNTRKHSSRRCTACPDTIYTSVANHQMSALVRFGVPQMNNFEQLSRLGHQMSLAGNVGQDQGQGGGSLYRGEPRVRAIGGCFLYGEVQCIMGNGHMGPPPLPKQNDRVRHLWKYYLPTISLAGGKDGKQLMRSVTETLPQLSHYTVKSYWECGLCVVNIAVKHQYVAAQGRFTHSEQTRKENNKG